MMELTEEIIQKLLNMGAELNNIESISRVMQTCFDDEDNLKKWDVETVFEFLKIKITETKINFNEIETALKI